MKHDDQMIGSFEPSRPRVGKRGGGLKGAILKINNGIVKAKLGVELVDNAQKEFVNGLQSNGKVVHGYFSNMKHDD